MVIFIKKMMKTLKIIGLAFTVLSLSCSSNDDGPPSGNGGGVEQPPQASYRITFEPKFTAEFHPNDFPANASFSAPVIIAHDANRHMFSLGSLATPGMELYAEEGDFSTLVSEHNQVEGDAELPNIITGTSSIGPEEAKEFIVAVTPGTTYISFVAKLSPSPDWFVGVDGFDLIDPDNGLKDRAEVTLFALDAGTDAGDTYNAADSPESLTIKQKLGLPFSSDPNETGKNLGKLIFERIDSN